MERTRHLRLELPATSAARARGLHDEPPRVDIRRAGESDLDAIVAIFNEAILERHAVAFLEPLRAEDRLAWFREHDEGHPIWIAHHEGEPLGWLSLSRWSERAAYDVTAEVSVYIAARARRRGIGKALVYHAMESAPALGIDTLLAGAFAHNVESIRLFEHLGFEHWAVLRGVAILDGIRRDVTYLGRRI